MCTDLQSTHQTSSSFPDFSMNFIPWWFFSPLWLFSLFPFSLHATSTLQWTKASTENSVNSYGLCSYISSEKIACNRTMSLFRCESFTRQSQKAKNVYFIYKYNISISFLLPTNAMWYICVRNDLYLVINDWPICRQISICFNSLFFGSDFFLLLTFKLVHSRCWLHLYCENLNNRQRLILMSCVQLFPIIFVSNWLVISVSFAVTKLKWASATQYMKVWYMGLGLGIKMFGNF